MRRRSIAVASLIIISAGFATSEFLDTTPTSQPRQTYIVQAQSLEQARALVARVDGEVTHELGIINAVGALLDEQQTVSLRSMPAVRRVYEDRSLETMDASKVIKGSKLKHSCELSAATELKFHAEKVTWTVTNTAKTGINLNKAMVIWPATNDELEGLEFGGTTIYEGDIDGISAAFDAVDSNLRDSRLHIRAGETRELRVEFGDDALEQQGSYEIQLFFHEGCSVGFPVPEKKKYAGDSDTEAKRTYIASLIGADTLHWKGITGKEVGVAIVDTGIWANPGKSKYLANDTDGKRRIVAHFDAIAGKEISTSASSDDNGHGSHVASVLASSRYKHSEFNGVAPDANLIIIKAFDDDGIGTYANVVRALDWAVKNKDEHQIRVLNLSFSAEPRSYYWDDPLNQAVMAAWRAGIVVVAAAGNSGPAAMTIGVPGNVPYVITAGAMTDSVTPMDWSDDTLASFSSAGPTAEAFVKPDLVAPGGHIRGMMGKENKIAKKHPHYHDGDAYYTMSGTSQATAVVSGVAALMLEAQPWLTPDQIKCKLMSSARPALDKAGAPAYSVFQQGAGMVDVVAALTSREGACANVGLDVNADIGGKTHFQGRADQTETGEYYVRELAGHTWDGTYNFSDGHLWAGGMLWNDGILWSRGMLWNDGIASSNGKLSSDGMLWNDGKPASVDVNIWVEQE